MNRLHSDLEGVWREISSGVPHTFNSFDRLDTGSIDAAFGLDPDQDRAARHDRGPIRVLAPAGSGKTRTLTARIARLVAGGVPPDRILALAFNTKAAGEMAERLAATGNEAVRPRTFHSLGYEIVRETGGPRFDPQDERRIHELAVEILERRIPLPAHAGERRRFVRRALGVLLAAKSRLTPYAEMKITLGGRCWSLAGAFDEWVSAQEIRGWLSYTDMIYYTVSRLAGEPEVRREWQARFDFILVDEFQDLNAAQMLLLRILAHPANNLFAVGDDDQLIYTWRGAEEAHILDFDRSFPGARSVVLGTNYRSGRRLVRHGRWLIERNTARVSKDIRAAGDAGPGIFEIVLRATAGEQARAAIDWLIPTKADADADWNDFGLLFRANRDAAILEEALAESGIPFRRVGAAQPDEPIDELVQENPVFEFQDDEGDGEAVRGAVTLMTIHKSKGVEFPYVVYFNLRGRPGTGEADERRVVYVGLTRAARGLLITADGSRPSPFLLELALNPGYDDFAEPYLERELTLARRRSFRRRGDWPGWVRTFLPGQANGERAMRLEPAGVEDDEADLLASELHFRRVLGIEKKA